MATENLIKVGTEIVFGAAASWNPADDGTNMSSGNAITHEMGMSALGNGLAIQSIKIDLGATRARFYSVDAAFDFTGETPVAGQSVDLYWAPSPWSTQANGNVGGNSGADAACPDGALGSITIAEFVLMCQRAGALIVHDGGVVQNGHCGIFSPRHRYGQMICYNRSGDAFEADEVETHIVMTPIVDEFQNT